MKVKLLAWMVAYFFTVNTVAVSVAISTDNELQQTFTGNVDLFDFFENLLSYFGKLMTFNIEGFNPLISFFIFYIPVLIIVGIVIEWIRGV